MKVFLIFFCILLDISISYAQKFIPISKGEIIYHTYYTLSYSEDNEQPFWVYYKLTREQVCGTTARVDNFRPDPSVSTLSAQLSDYKTSGYDRGHLCPAADMKLSQQAMSETFYLSNMSPQDQSFNRGIWSKLEDAVRQIAVQNQQIYVVTGPVFKDCIDTIGVDKVTVPGYFYKVIYIPAPKPQMIGFLLPNKQGEKQISEYLLPVDSIELLTGIDFFPQLSDDSEAALEASISNEFDGFEILSPDNHNYVSSSSNHSVDGSTQCLGIAKSTKQRCKSRTTNQNGYCTAHQSQAPKN